MDNTKHLAYVYIRLVSFVVMICLFLLLIRLRSYMFGSLIWTRVAHFIYAWKKYPLLFPHSHDALVRRCEGMFYFRFKHHRYSSSELKSVFRWSLLFPSTHIHTCALITIQVGLYSCLAKINPSPLSKPQIVMKWTVCRMPDSRIQFYLPVASLI